MDSDSVEQVGWVMAYKDGYADGKAGRPQDARGKMKEALTSKPGASGRNAAQPSAQELADRAAAYQADKAKAGVTVSNMDAVRFVYEQAGVPLG